MVFRLLALLGVLVGLASGAQAQDVSDADRTAIRDIIQSQVDAFRRDDGDAAFGLASPSIRGGVCATAAKGQASNPARRNRERIVI